MRQEGFLSERLEKRAIERCGWEGACDDGSRGDTGSGGKERHVFIWKNGETREFRKAHLTIARVNVVVCEEVVEETRCRCDESAQWRENGRVVHLRCIDQLRHFIRCVFDLFYNIIGEGDLRSIRQYIT